MGDIAEVFTGHSQQLRVAEATVIEPLDTDDARQQIGVVPLQVAQQHLAQIALTAPMTEQQHDIGLGQRRCDGVQIGMVAGSALTGEITVMPMGEILATAPHPMRAQHRVLHHLAFKAEDIGVVMIQMKNKAAALITAHPVRGRLGMIGADTEQLQKTAQTQHSLGIEIGLAAATAAADPGFRSGGHPDAQAVIRELRHLRPQSPTEGLHPGGAHAMAERMGEQGLQGVEMRLLHESFAVLRQAYRAEAVAILTPP